MKVSIVGFYMGYRNGYITLSDVDIEGVYHSRLIIKSNKLNVEVGLRVKLNVEVNSI